MAERFLGRPSWDGLFYDQNASGYALFAREYASRAKSSVRTSLKVNTAHWSAMVFFLKKMNFLKYVSESKTGNFKVIIKKGNHS